MTSKPRLIISCFSVTASDTQRRIAAVVHYHPDNFIFPYTELYNIRLIFIHSLTWSQY